MKSYLNNRNNIAINYWQVKINNNKKIDFV